MADLHTRYMGLALKTPFVVAASSISGHLDRIKLAEEAGAGALVIRSLFEEQIQMEAMRLDEALDIGIEGNPEAQSYFPNLKHGGADEHLMWVEKARQAVGMPLIASLNAVSPGGWTRYARQLESTGVDGLELNVYAVAADLSRSGADVERELYDVVAAVQAEVKLPVAVKLSPFYSSMANVAAELDRRKVAALVLFNRFLQPDIDPETEELKNEMVYSGPEEIKLPLRWVALLYGRVKADLILNTGVHSGLDAAKAILAGAAAVQSASALLINGIPFLSTMLRQFESWMDEHGYPDLAAMRGKLSQQKVEDLYGFERAQYVKLLVAQK
jgi:dihydroorotate dehydrogenase (fumarate)